MTPPAPRPPRQEWLPVGEEPQPLGSITDCAILRNGGVSVVALEDGTIDAGTHEATGVYSRDTRHLSLLRLTLGGVAPLLLDASQTGAVHSAVFTNPAMQGPDGTVIPARTLIVRRRRVLERGLAESITVSNYGAAERSFELRIAFDADFRDIFEVRGYARRSPRGRLVRSNGGDRAVFRYDGLDGVRRETHLRFEPRPTALRNGEALYHVRLGPRDTFTAEVRVRTAPGPVDREPLPAIIRRVQADERRFLRSVTSVRTDYEPLSQAIEQALLDVYALRTAHDGESFVAAGVPWFDTLFGRDSLITGIFLAAYAPDVLRAALRNLAREQAETTDPATDAEPGKIPHELRWGELARIGEVPFARYYGSVDATPLFLIAADEYLAWTGDARTIRELWPPIQRAVRWCVERLEAANGFLAYARRSARGLENQGWKDSHDAIVWPDGRLAAPPIALVEAQAYCWAALVAFANMASLLDEDDSGALEVASALRGRFERAFAHEELGYVLCLERARVPVPTPASNAAHALWVGAASERAAAAVARRLFREDLFTGWGIRTLSSDVAGYNPLGYHTGSVWPHDNAIALAGLRRYGFDELAYILGTAFIEAALAFPAARIPELYSGDPRELRLVPTPFPVASRPQAWSAASLPYVMASLLGLRPAGPRALAVVRPVLPLELEWVQVRNLRFAGASIDLTFRRSGDRVAVEVDDVRGDVEIVLSRSWPRGAAGPKSP